MNWQMKCISAALILVSAFASLSSAGETSGNKCNDLGKYFAALAQNREFSGNVLIAEKGHIIYEHSFGFADRETKRPNVATTTFPTASVAKTLTAIAILQLKEKGNLRLDDPVVRYLSEFPYPAITIRHLLSHTSGLPTYEKLLDARRTANPDAVFTNADFLADIRDTKVPMEFQPGDQYEYNNTNYLVLALIIEKVSGISYLNYIKEHILAPAGMNDTNIVLSFADYRILQEQTDFAGPCWYPHFFYSDELIKPDTIPFYAGHWRAYSFKGFSDYTTTTHDLLKYDEALYNGKLLSDASLRAAFTPVKLNNGKVNPSGYGLGWEIDENSPYGKLVNHSGGMMGLSCVLLRNLTRHQTIIIYANILPDNYTFVIDLPALKILNGGSVDYPRKTMARAFGRVLVTEGIDAAMNALRKMKADPATYILWEDDFNSLAYDLMGDSNDLQMPEQHKYAEAL